MKLSLCIKRNDLLDLPAERMDPVERRFIRSLNPDKGIESYDTDWLLALWDEYCKRGATCEK